MKLDRLRTWNIFIGYAKANYLSIYKVTRHFGGPEEGGWWYNWNEHIATFPIPRTYRKKRQLPKLMAWKDRVLSRYLGMEHGNIYLSTGGEKIESSFEQYPREDETKRTPHYE